VCFLFWYCYGLRVYQGLRQCCASLRQSMRDCCKSSAPKREKKSNPCKVNPEPVSSTSTTGAEEGDSLQEIATDAVPEKGGPAEAAQLGEPVRTDVMLSPQKRIDASATSTAACVQKPSKPKAVAAKTASAAKPPAEKKFEGVKHRVGEKYLVEEENKLNALWEALNEDPFAEPPGETGASEAARCQLGGVSAPPSAPSASQGQAYTYAAAQLEYMQALWAQLAVDDDEMQDGLELIPVPQVPSASNSQRPPSQPRPESSASTSSAASQASFIAETLRDAAVFGTNPGCACFGASATAKSKGPGSSTR